LHSCQSKSANDQAYRMPFTAQSKVEKRPPQTPKLPPRTGERALMAVIAVCQNISVSNF
jgi:hypothetical protein